MQGWGKQKTYAHLMDACLHAGRFEGNVDTQSFQQVRTATLARGRTIPMLGHYHTRSRCDQGGGRRNIKRLRAIASSARSIDWDRAWRGANEGRFVPHHAGAARDLVNS